MIYYKFSIIVLLSPVGDKYCYPLDHFRRFHTIYIATFQPQQNPFSRLLFARSNPPLKNLIFTCQTHCHYVQKYLHHLSPFKPLVIKPSDPSKHPPHFKFNQTIIISLCRTSTIATTITSSPAKSLLSPNHH